MSRGPWYQRWTREHPVLVDSVVAAVVLVADVTVTTRSSGYVALTPVSTALTALALALMPLRHRWLMPALVATLVVTSAVLVLRGPGTSAVLAPQAVVYLVALRRRRGVAVAAGVVTAVVLLVAGALGQPDGSILDVLDVLPWTLIALVVGAWVRSRRAYLAEVEERAERAERTREDEARRQVAEERLRIARELHDVVAHHTAVVTVQAGVAQHLLTTRPQAAAEALGRVRDAAAAVLDELGDILSVLREPGGGPDRSGGSGGPGGSGGSGGGRAPTPGLDRLDALVESFATAGLEVRWSLDGRPRPLPSAVDLVAYRLVEESLTNALKHGTGSALLRVEHSAGSLRLYVENPVRTLVTAGAAAGAGTGHGTVGMRERATAVGGTVTVGPVGDRFVVEALLPLREGARP